MPRRLLALLVALLAIVLALTVPASGQVQRIKPGISAAGVDLSGLTVPEAAARLDQQLAPRLQGDMILGAAGVPWKLTMAEAQLKLDSVRTAKRALYAKAGVTTVQHIFREKSHNGRSLPIDATRKAIDAQLDDPAAPRKVHAPLQRLKPKVTFGNLARVYNTVLTIDRPHFKLRLFKGLKFSKSYGIAVGMAGLETPAGRYAIQNKQVDPAWHVPNSAWAGSLAGQVIPGGAPNNPLRARWLGIANGVGIHGTAEDWSIGTRASHGCIRMHVADVIDLFRRVPVGTPVLIV